MAIKIAGTEVINDNRELVLAKLTEINTSIADTAVDVFVYDTRKDSDGGQWRHRCQHTSWYNETLNTATRGSRKEFPAVAVIVAEQEQITIYDGDDPDLPMWMVFNTNSGWSMLYYGTGVLDVSAVAMLNGKLCVTSNNNPSTYAAGVTDIDFVKDRGAIWYKTGSSGGYSYFDEPISGRNVAALGLISISSATVVHYNLNDVAMTVLPNAPIDAATGLPVPTIAVATDGGVSVIKDDGTVVDITHTASTNNGATDISFNGNQISYATQQSGSSTNYWRKAFIDIPSADVTGSYTHNISGMTVYDARGTSSNSGVVLNTNSNLGDATNDIKAAVHDAVGFTNKLTLLDVDYYSDAGTPSESGSMVAYVASDHNTGWMNGDIKLATLSDTDATNVTGSELVTNGTFDTNYTGWAEARTGTILSVVSGQLKVERGSTGDYGVEQTTISVVSGKTYVLSFDYDVSNITNSGLRSIYVNETTTLPISGYLVESSDPNVGAASVTFTATSTGDKEISFRSVGGSSQSSGDYFLLDNVSIRVAEEDRSVNGNGLQVFGTVTKSAVATGADLVSYRSNGSLLAVMSDELTSIADGDFAINVWAKFAFDGLYEYVCQFNNNDGAFGIHFSSISSTKRLQLSGMGVQSNTDVLVENKWQMITAVRRNGVVTFYVDGKDAGGGSSTTPLSYSHLRLLRLQYNTSTYGDSSTNEYALFRLSATAPSPEQIKKIYEDEKVLFQEGAQATLYGSSDAVTALAYDDSTELLHVGTSAGRSVFQGLRRVDKTTTAVGAAISASNSMVAED